MPRQVIRAAANWPNMGNGGRGISGRKAREVCLFVSNWITEFREFRSFWYKKSKRSGILQKQFFHNKEKNHGKIHISPESPRKVEQPTRVRREYQCTAPHMSGIAKDTAVVRQSCRPCRVVASHAFAQTEFLTVYPARILAQLRAPIQLQPQHSRQTSFIRSDIAKYCSYRQCSRALSCDIHARMLLFPSRTLFWASLIDFVCSAAVSYGCTTHFTATIFEHINISTMKKKPEA